MPNAPDPVMWDQLLCWSREAGFAKLHAGNRSADRRGCDSENEKLSTGTANVSWSSKDAGAHSGGNLRG